MARCKFCGCPSDNDVCSTCLMDSTAGVRIQDENMKRSEDPPNGRLSDNSIKFYSSVSVSGFIKKTLTPDEIQYVIDRESASMERMVVSVSHCPLCRKFYYKRCVGCVYYRFGKGTIKGCNRFYKIKCGETTNRKSQELRIEIYKNALPKGVTSGTKREKGTESDSNGFEHEWDGDNR